MTIGTIKKISDRGFGFIERHGERDIFMHVRDFPGVLWTEELVGEEVEFNVTEGSDGRTVARDVRLTAAP